MGMLKMQVSNGNYISDLDDHVLSNLPADILIEILSRLPFRSIYMSKLVCREWRDLVRSREFGRKHYMYDALLRRRLSQPYSYLMVSSYTNRDHQILELLDNNNVPKKFVTFTTPHKELVHSSVDGLLLLSRVEEVWIELEQGDFLFWSPTAHLLVCNPVTREYLRLPKPRAFEGHSIKDRRYSRRYFGFGMSSGSRQYKVVVMLDAECQVYTLGTGRWRSVSVWAPLDRALVCCNKWENRSACVDGKLYWVELVTVPGVPCLITCFDLQTEVLSSLPPPPPPPLGPNYTPFRNLCVLEGCLCLCVLSQRFGYASGDKVKIDIWLRRGQDWTKEFVIKDVNRPYIYKFVFPIKVLEDGGVLMWEKGDFDGNISYYESRTTKDGGQGRGRGCKRLYSKNQHILGSDDFYTSAVFTPNFIPLKSLLMENKDNIRSF